MYLPAAKEKQNNNQPVQHVSQGQEKNKKNKGVPTAREKAKQQPTCAAH